MVLDKKGGYVRTLLHGVQPRLLKLSPLPHFYRNSTSRAHKTFRIRRFDMNLRLLPRSTCFLFE